MDTSSLVSMYTAMHSQGPTEIALSGVIHNTAREPGTGPKGVYGRCYV